MPRVEEVQFVHWGSLRPDPVPLLGNGINVATGPNGSGKTCFLDGIKLLLGVTDFAAGRSPAKYMFDGAGAGMPADRAYLRATFANPIGPDRHHRVFAWAGHGCERAERVTVVSVVSGQERWYVVLPGRVRWGAEGRKLAEDLAEIVGLPRSRRLGPRQYDDLLDKTGVTKALRGVLALPQGATDRLVEERPVGLLRRLLELTGKQMTLDEFREQRERYQQVRSQYDDTLRRSHGEQKHVELLEVKARNHLDWVSKRDEVARLENLLLPAARYRDGNDKRQQAVAERDQRREAVEQDEAALAEVERDLPALSASLLTLDEEIRKVERDREQTDSQLGALDQEIGRLRNRLDSTMADRDRARALVVGIALEDAARSLRDAEEHVLECTAQRQSAMNNRQRIEAEIASLRAGRPIPPAGLEAFRRLLADEGISQAVVAEAADLRHGEGDSARLRAEAALGHALWAVVVPVEAYARAVQLAVQEGHRWPVAIAGPGNPRASLSLLEGPANLGLLLEHLDADALEGPVTADGREGVSLDGVRYGRVMSYLAAPEKPILGRRAREQRLKEAELEAEQVVKEIERLDAELPALRRALEQARVLADAVRRLPDLEMAATQVGVELERAGAKRPPLEERQSLLQKEKDRLLDERGGQKERVRGMEQRREDIETRLTETRRPQLERYERLAQELGESLAKMQLSPEQRAAVEEGSLPATTSLEQDAVRLHREVDDTERFPGDVRDELILAQRDDQRRIVEEVDALLRGRQEDLDRQQQLVDEARRRYDDHVRAVVRLLNAEFAQICTEAGMEGEIRSVPGERPEELGVDVRVAHRAGEPRRSYRDATHSGGQRAKIAILLLLAAMGLGGAADLLVMDEHIAHLDSTNIDHIAELMGKLKGRVQFILATPTNAESLRLGWCDLQLAFLPRSSGEPYTPPIRVLTRLGADDLESRFVDAQLSIS